MVCLGLVLSIAARAQTITGSVNGVVTDSTGAVVQNAKVVAKSADTNIETTATTNGSGQYNLRFLQIGHYVLTITAPGFKTFQSNLFTLEVDQTAKIDGSLQTGSATDTVTVSSEMSPILDTDNSTINSTFTANTVANLPLNGQNFSSVTMFIPGAVATSPTGMSGQFGIERDTGQEGQVSINGNRNQTNNYMLDGVEINETINNVIGYNPAPEAIENLTTITSNASAEYGNVNGGDVITVLKSGTNTYHGSAYGYLENDNLDANSWANNFAGTPRQPFTQAIFGGTFGGAIKKDKLFYFIDYEGARFHTGGTETDSVIPEAFRNGDFSAIGTQLYHFVDGVRTPYVNNQVPITNPVAKYLFAHPEYYPLPNQTGTPLSILNSQNNYSGPYKKTERNDQGDVKIDYRLSNKDSVSARYSQGEGADAQPKAGLALEFPAANSYPFKGIALNYVHTFNSAIVNEARAGWSRVRWVQGVPIDSTGAFSAGNSVVGINSQQPYAGFAAQVFSGTGQGTTNTTYFTTLGTDGSGSSLIDNTFTYADDLTWQLAKHTLKMGVEVLRYQQNNFYPGNDGIMGNEGYTGAFTGSTIPDFVTGQVYSAGISKDVGRSGQRQYRDAAFIQDDWKATAKLTFNIGVRYEYDQPIYEVNNKQANLDLDTGSYWEAGTAGAATAFGDNRALYHPTYTNFMPRIGFAYNPKQRFVIRGGYGITNYLEGTGANLRLNFNPPFQPSYTYTAIAASATSPGTPLDTTTALPANFTSSTSSNTIRAWDKHLKPAFIQEFSLSTEYQLNNQTSVVASYLGQTGQHLIDARAANQLAAAGETAPYAATVGQTGSVVETQTESMMNYNALQVQLRHRQSEGLEYMVNYTFAKAMTNNPGFFGTAGVSGASAYWQNAYDGHADYGPSGFDTRHNLSATAVYELPFGRGRRHAANINRVLDEAIGGWKLSGTAIAYSGFPVTINGPNSTSLNNKAQRANHYRKMVVRDRSVGNWWGTDPSASPCKTAGENNDVCAYGATSGNNFGTASVGSERAPGYENIDLTAGKSFSITESQKVEFRSDFFNAFNMASYSNPDNGITDSNFGQITAARNNPRQIQFSVRYRF
jgi:hypothetical protein